MTIQSVTVHNMSTDEKHVYMEEDLTPQKAVILAYIQHELDNWSTWEYPQLMKGLEPKLEYGLMTVGLGDYAANVHMLKVEGDQLKCTCGKWSVNKKDRGIASEEIGRLFDNHVDRVRWTLLEKHKHIK